LQEKGKEMKGKLKKGRTQDVAAVEGELNEPHISSLFGNYVSIVSSDVCVEAAREKSV